MADGSARSRAAGIATARLSEEDYRRNFSDLHPPLSKHEAQVESDRCYFCYDAPCVTACPTSIDIPLFIRQISADNANGAARTILSQNIFGGMCARDCPTETLCEEACVRNLAEDKPVEIGRLQRYATDSLLASGAQPFERGAPSGKRVAVVGGGPAGLACAHRLALHGHAVTVFEAREKLGGLNEYGIAAYKVAGGAAEREVDFLLAVGGIETCTGVALGRDVTLAQLRADFDAVFLGMGLAGVNALGQEGEDLPGVLDAVDYIAELRQAQNLSELPVGRRVVVIGGGMTAIDVAVQSKRLGAEDVTIVYRRGQDAMKASEYEQDLAQTNGVKIKHWGVPRRILTQDGNVSGIEFRYGQTGVDGRLEVTEESFTLDADVIFKAIGQTFIPAVLGESLEALDLSGGRLRVDEERRTSLPDVWAGGDCVAGGSDLTVAAVEDGKQAAESIHATFSNS
jgi:glutamate synthase (NADPH/NADH) small chain